MRPQGQPLLGCERHGNAEAERNAEVGLRNREKALGERIARRERQRDERQRDGVEVEREYEAECGQRTHGFEGRMERLMDPAFAGQKEIDHNTSGKRKNNHPAGNNKAEPHDDAVPAIHAASIPPMHP